jgi:cation transport regulator ChaC
MTAPSAADGVWYFAYGSNMHPAIFCERRGMRPRVMRPGRLADYRLCFNLAIGPGERGVGNIELADGECTWGVLYLLTDEELTRLDKTEGVGFGAYARMVLEVVAADGERVLAHTYHSTRTCEGRKPSARYLGLLLEGARRHGLPAEYVATLEASELAIDEREGAAAPPTS